MIANNCSTVFHVSSRFALLVCLATTIAVAGEKPQPVEDLLLVRRETKLYRLDDGAFVVECRVRAQSTLRLHSSRLRLDGDSDDSLHYVLVRSTIGDRLVVGWVCNDHVVNLTKLKAEAREKKTGDLPTPLEQGDMPQLIYMQGDELRGAWREVQAAIKENLKLPKADQLSEPFFARAAIWTTVGNHHDALQDYLKGSAILRRSGKSLSDYAVFFVKLFESLKKVEESPAPPYVGVALEQWGLGKHAYEDGRLFIAKKYFDNAIQLGPESPVYWYYRAILHKILDEDTLAVRDARIGVEKERRLHKEDRRRREIGDKLNDIQGIERIWLEDFRSGDPSAWFPKAGKKKGE